MEINISVWDLAENESRGNLDLAVPGGLPFILSDLYPTGTVYDHSPVIQLHVQPKEPFIVWHPRLTVIRDSAEVILDRVVPSIRDGNILQLPVDLLLDDGNYEVNATIVNEEGETLVERNWSFEIATMMYGSIE